jgi:protocatechuate 3,4-dioxygenase beta subunit
VVVEQDQPLLAAPVASALTGGDGVAALSGVPFGNWRLLVVHPELARHRRKLEIVAERMELEITLERGVRIEGVVVDASGRGVAGATVRVLSAESDAEHGKQETSSSGAFAIAGLDVGSYRLYAHTGRHRPRYEGPLSLPEHGQVRRVTIRLEEGRTLSGRVVDARGAPVVGAHVGAADEGSAFVSSDEQGRFELAGLADAPTNMFATAPVRAYACALSIPVARHRDRALASGQHRRRGRARLQRAA